MTLPEALSQHLQLCDELHQLVLEENRFLKTRQQTPDASLLDRRRTLLERLDSSLQALKTPEAAAVPADGSTRALRASLIEKSRARVLQILHLQRENEQLLLRYSLGAPKSSVLTPPAPPPARHLQKLYERHG